MKSNTPSQDTERLIRDHWHRYCHSGMSFVNAIEYCWQQREICLDLQLKEEDIVLFPVTEKGRQMRQGNFAVTDTNSSGPGAKRFQFDQGQRIFRHNVFVPLRAVSKATLCDVRAGFGGGGDQGPADQQSPLWFKYVWNSVISQQHRFQWPRWWSGVLVICQRHADPENGVPT